MHITGAESFGTWEKTCKKFCFYYTVYRAHLARRALPGVVVVIVVPCSCSWSVLGTTIGSEPLITTISSRHLIATIGSKPMWVVLSCHSYSS